MIRNESKSRRGKMRLKLQSILAKLLFPSQQMDWYARYGYKGNSPEEVFTNFVKAQENDTKRWPKDLSGKNEWNNIKASRMMIKSYSSDTTRQSQIDTVSFEPTDSKGKPGEGLHIVNFFGRGEYYECNFRDMLREAHATGATIHAFNPSGMNSSTGKIKEFNDLVNDGISVINQLLKDGVHPDKIVLQGNCLGGAIQEAVARHFEEQCGIKMRQINSNSFKSIKSVLINLYPLKLLENQVKKLLEWTGWEIKPGKHFGETGPYKCHMHRKDDQTIASEAKMHNKVEKHKNARKIDPCPEDFREARDWLDNHALMECVDKKIK